MRVKYIYSSRRTRHIKNMRKQKQKFPDIAQKILNEADIILEVLDARFINETRNYAVEKYIKEHKKELIYVINKADLSSRTRIKLNPSEIVSCKERKGIKRLRDKIKIIALKIKEKSSDKKIPHSSLTNQMKEKIVVGVIGYPNTGKSSLINLLIGRSSAGTGADAGFTKGMQKLRLSSNIVLLDSPGVIPKEEYSSINQEELTKHTKVGARSYSQIKEPEMVIAGLIIEFPNVLEKFYNIDSKGDSEILIEELGRKKGFIKKGNEVDEDKTARLILKDWQSGKIRV